MREMKRDFEQIALPRP